MKRIGVICKDDFLFQKIRLSLIESAECTRLSENEKITGLDLYLVDKDSEIVLPPAGAFTMSRHGECDLKIPFSKEELVALVNAKDERGDGISLTENEKAVFFKKRSIKLTELEFSLLSVLLSERRFFSKEELLLRVWKGEADAGIINVYIHYLREKLELDGEKVIISARNRGYKIDERFLGEGV